ncbi:MAG: hypothetical protein IJP92_03150 [Lachnospiraceae bacterium]|nr:hypothetical protein [Lachnospiraceae bacterium]
MIRAQYQKKTSVYTIRLTQHNVGDTKSILFKFDTGAVSTIIGIRTLFDTITEEQIIEFRKYFSEAQVKEQRFSVATGHKLHGYPCAFSDIMLSGEQIDWFPFYLIMDTDRKVALIGNDFITHCAFDHKPDDDIIIHGYQKDRLRESFLENNLNTFELNQIDIGIV